MFRSLRQYPDHFRTPSSLGTHLGPFKHFIGLNFYIYIYIYIYNFYYYYYYYCMHSIITFILFIQFHFSSLFVYYYHCHYYHYYYYFLFFFCLFTYLIGNCLNCLDSKTCIQPPHWMMELYNWHHLGEYKQIVGWIIPMHWTLWRTITTDREDQHALT